MTSTPPHPDDDLARFHNGDTLDNIPVVRPPSVRKPLRRRAPLIAIAALVAAVVGALAAVGIATQLDGGEHSRAARPAGGAPVATSSVAAPATVTSSPSASASEPTQVAKSPWVEPKATVVEQVRIIQTPATGGDPGASFCLVYTGTSSGAEREAIMLMNAPAYQCQDMLPVDPTGETSPLVTEAPDCAAPARAAVLSFAETGGWENEVMYACLTAHHGA